jgi:integrase
LTHIVPKIAEAAGLGDVRCHDLRRTVATFIQSQFGSEIMDEVLNHQKQNKVTAAYGLYDFDKEKKAALIWWNNKLNEIVNGRIAKVVSIAA